MCTTRPVRHVSLTIFSFLILVGLQSGLIPAQEKRLPKQQSREGTRQFYHGKPIKDLIAQTEDDVIEILQGGFPPLRVEPPPGTSAIEWETNLASTVLRIEILSKESKLATTQKWVVTDVEARILEVLKENIQNFDIGQRVSFLEQGGEIKIGEKTVRALVGWAEPFKVGSEYLVFVTVAPSGDLLVRPGNSYGLVESGKFKSLLTRQPPANEFSEQPADVVLQRIRDYVAARPLRKVRP